VASICKFFNCTLSTSNNGLVIYSINTENTKCANIYGSVINEISVLFSVGIAQVGQRHGELNIK
jgi:hypothetical protein